MVVKVGDLVMLREDLGDLAFRGVVGVGVIIGPAHRLCGQWVVTVSWTDGTCCDEWNTRLKPYEGDAGKKHNVIVELAFLCPL